MGKPTAPPPKAPVKGKAMPKAAARKPVSKPSGKKPQAKQTGKRK
jgi:hypothetical protein